MVLLDNREVKQGWSPLKEAVAEIFTKHGGEVVSARRWDERRLAYPIKGQTRGTYLLVYFNAGSDANSQIRRDLKMNERR
jgi:small subunit ribosomal protein S6